MFHFIESENLKYVHVLIHHTGDAEFQGASALNSERNDSKITHLLEMVAVLEMPLEIEADDTSTYLYIRI